MEQISGFGGSEISTPMWFWFRKWRCPSFQEVESINRIKQILQLTKSGGCSQVAALVGKVQHATNVTGS